MCQRRDESRITLAMELHALAGGPIVGGGGNKYLRGERQILLPASTPLLGMRGVVAGGGVGLTSHSTST